jgi:hypothetical protein
MAKHSCFPTPEFVVCILQFGETKFEFYVGINNSALVASHLLILVMLGISTIQISNTN